MNHKSFCRQFAEWTPFLPTGTRPTWLSFNEDPTRGIHVTKQERNAAGDVVAVPDEVETNKARNALEEFLVCLGTYSPENFIHTILHESTSYTWVLEKLQDTFNLNTRGVKFLAGCDVKIDTGEDGQTHQQIFQAVKEFYCSSLLKKGDKFKGKPLATDEVLTPFGENILVEKWLDLINPSLKSHILQTRGSLFTEERPNLSDNQRQICDQMETLLQEIEQKKENPSMNRTVLQENPSMNRTGFPPQNYLRRQSRQQTPRVTHPFRPNPRQVPAGAGQTNSSGRASCPPNMCIRCYEAGRVGPASRTHYANSCPHPPNRPRNNMGMKILLVPAREDAQHSANYNPYPAQIQEIQINDNLLQQGADLNEGHEPEDYYEDDALDYDFNSLSLNKYAYPYQQIIPDTDTSPIEAPNINLIPTKSIQKFTFLSSNIQVVLAIDSGCEGNCMTEEEATRLNINILPLDKADLIPNQADGTSQLNTIGSVITVFNRDGLQLKFRGYVVKELSQPIL